MRKLFFVTAGLLCVVIGLAACGGAKAQDAGTAAAVTEAPVASGNAVTATNRQLSENYQDALPVAAQLILGSLKLEEGDNAIDSGEAAKLLPLWQAYQSLSSSDTTATAELDALVSQIQSTMQPGQVAAIAAMQLTATSIPDILQVQGGGLFRGDRAGTGTGSFAAPPAGGFPGGGPGGGFPGGGPGRIPGGGFGDASPEAQATAIAERMAQGGDQAATFMTRGMLNQLIITLQLKTGEVTEAELAAQRAQRPAMRWLPLVADATGISADALQEAMTNGQTLGEAITATGGDLAAVKAALHDALKNDSDLDEQAIAEQIDAVLNAKAPSE